MTNFQSAVLLVVVAGLFYFGGWMSQPSFTNQLEFKMELANCQIETQEPCSFVAMPDSSFTHIHFLYASHVR